MEKKNNITLEINGWDTGIKFSASHFIPTHKRCSRLHGHDYGIRFKIHGELNESMILMDFTEIKKNLKKIADELDHYVLLPSTDKFYTISKKGESVEVLFENKRYIFPAVDVKFIDVDLPSAESLSIFIAREFIKNIKIPENIDKIEVCVDEGKGQGSWYSLSVNE